MVVLGWHERAALKRLRPKNTQRARAAGHKGLRYVHITGNAGLITKRIF